MTIIITIDGPAGTGKSTISRKLARNLGYNHVDTGAMYRAVAYAYLQRNISIDEINLILDSPIISFIIKDNALVIKFYETVLNEELRSKEVTQTSSALAKLPQVRSYLVQKQRDFASLGNAVFEGRDIGSIVFPNANFKFFLTASIEERVNRRARQLEEQNQVADREQLFLAIAQRDKNDQERKISPLIMPKNSFLIDTTSLTINEVIDKMLSVINQKN